MDLKNFISIETTQIEQSLQNYLDSTKNDLNQINQLLGELFNYFIEANKDGKRLRALLLKLGYQMSGGKDKKNIVKPMMAIEIFHTAILAHDDIIDQSPLRRGKPTVHHALGNDHHAISQTIVLADYGFFLATKLIAESDFDEKKKNRALQIFNSIVLDTAIGEIIDVEIPYKKLAITTKDANTISLFKTARYTFTGPLQIGAALAGADGEQLKKIQQFGDDLGIAFQIQDDMLGVFGLVDETGKSNLSDLTEGKVTLMASHAFTHCLPEQKKLLNKLYGKVDLTEKEAELVRHIFTDSGALDFSRESALKYTQSAVSKIDQLDIDLEYKTILRQLADFLMERRK